MTKEVFEKFYSLFTTLVKQEVNDEYIMNANCHLIDHCGGYELELHPQALMWGNEFALIEALCGRFYLSFEIRLYSGVLTIR